MASQLYSHQGDNEYRVLSKEGNGALASAAQSTPRESMNTPKPRSPFFLEAHRQVF